jgi:hypothetical protein
MIDGYNTLKYAFLNFQGTQLSAAQDLSEMVYMHVDFWTPNAAALKIFLVSQTTGEKSYAFEIELENWVSVNIPLSHFTDQGLGLTDIHQLKVEGNGTVYFDNIFFSKTMSSVESRNSSSVFAIGQNYPNPFNSSTSIKFSLLEAKHITLTVYNMAGEKVLTLIDEYMDQGDHSVDFKADHLTAGTYYYTISDGMHSFVNRMILIK